MKKKYIAPRTEMSEVELEDGFMKASTFEPGEEHKGVSIEGHQVGNTGDYTLDGLGWDQPGSKELSDKSPW